MRTAVAEAAQEAQSAHGAAIEEVEQSAEWPELDAATREALVADAGLRPIATPDVATDDQLLAALDSVSLAAWRERRQALPAKAAAARGAAAKLLQPKSVEVKAPHATLRTADEVEAYLANLCQILMGHVDSGETVIL